MPRGLTRTTKRADAVSASSGFIRIRYPIVGQTLTVAAAGAGVGFGSLAFGLPEGYLLLMVAGGNVTYTTTSANITNVSFTGNVGVGTIATVAGALTTTEVDLVSSLATTATAKSVTKQLVSAGTIPRSGILDNHTKNQSMFLNVAVAAADIADASSAPFTVNGYIDLILAVLGDN